MSRQMSTSLRVFKNFSTRILGRLVGSLIGIAAMAMLTRHLGEARYGEYAFWYNLIFVIQMFGDVGLQVIIVREIARKPESRGLYFGDAIMLKAVLSTILMLVVLVLAWLVVPQPSVPFLIIVSLAAVVGLSQDIAIWVFRGVEAMEYEALLSVFNQAVWIATLALLIRGDRGIALLLGAQLAANVLRTVLGFVLTLAKGIKPSFHADLRRYKQLLTDSIPVGLGFMISGVAAYVNIGLLKWLARPEDIASFSVGMTLTQGFLFLPVILATSFFPVFSRYIHTKDARLPSFYAQTSRVLVLVAAPVTVVFMCLAKEIIALMCGPKGFTDAILSLQILGFTLILGSLNRMYRFVLPASDRQIRYLVNEALGVACNLTLSLALIPRFQFVGACVALSLGQTFLFLLNYVFYSRVVSPLPMGQVFIKPLLASLGMGAVLLAVRGLNIFLVCGIGALVYPGFLFLFRALTIEDLKFIKGMGDVRGGSGDGEEENHG